MCRERHDPKFQTQPLSFSSCRRMLISSLPRSHIPMAASVVQELAGCVCVSECAGRGLFRVFSFLAPSWPMRSWWSLSPLALQRWFPLSPAAHSQMHQERWWWWALVCGHVLLEPVPLEPGSNKEKQEGHAHCCLKRGFKSNGLSS